MKKFLFSIRGIVSVVLSASFLFAVGCAEVPEGGTEVAVWGAYNTVKIMQDSDAFTHFDPKIEVQLAKGEREGAQLVLRPDHDVASYDLVTADLVNGEGDVFPAEQIVVYKQGYLKLIQKSDFNTNYAYPAGNIPDFLLPLEKAVQYGENTIGKGQNQSLTVDFYADGVEAGKYTGNFMLITDGAKKNIPVSVTVWNFDLSVNTGKSSFVLQIDSLMHGEMDSTLAMQKAYYEVMLEYKINGTYLPGTDVSPQCMVENLLEYWNHPGFTTYSLPVGSSAQKYAVNVTLYKQYLKEVVRASSPDLRLLTKCSTYLLLLDEPQAFNGEEYVIREIGKLTEAGQSAFAELEAEGYFDEFPAEYKNTVREDIADIDFVVTSPYNPIFEDTAITYCPQFNLYEETASAESLAAHAEKFGTEQWWYGCVSPRYPYPTYHIDDFLIGARAEAWMRKSKAIVGNLYWCVNTYHRWNSGSKQTVLVDPYTDPVRFVSGAGGTSGTAGDGYLLYPGSKYKTPHPFASLRLMAVRDGQDDFDMITKLQDTYAELADLYGKRNDGVVNDILAPLYQTIFRGSTYTSDDSRLYAARQKVAELIEFTQATDLYIGEYTERQGKVFLSFCLPVESTFKVNGQVLQGTSLANGEQFGYVASLTEADNDLTLEVVREGKTEIFDLVLPEKTLKATTDKTTVSVSKKSELTEINESTLDLIIRSDGVTEIEKFTFTPKFALSASAFVCPIDEIGTLSLDLTNKTDNDVVVEVYVAGTNGAEKFDEIVLYAKENREVVFRGIGDLKQRALDGATAIEFRFENVDEANRLLPDRGIMLSDVYYEVRS